MKIGGTIWSTAEYFSRWHVRSEYPPLVDGLHSMGFDKERAYWLGVYDDVYLPLVERVMEQAQQSGFVLKHSRQVYGVHATSLCGQTVGFLRVVLWYSLSVVLQMIVLGVVCP